MSDKIDQRAVSALISEVGDEAARRLFAVFRAECGTFAAALEEEFRRGKIDQVCVVAHSLKGSARQFGAHKLSDLCRTLETLSETGPEDNSEISAAISDVVKEARLVQDHIDATLAGHPAQP